MRARIIFLLAAFTAAASILVVSASDAHALPGLTSGAEGYDISWPQCGGPLPAAGSFDFAIVGVNGGKALTKNACLSSQLSWAQTNRSGTGAGLYLNTNAAPKSYRGPGCGHNDSNCANYQYGKAAATDALTYAGSSGGGSVQWYWLDVETGNSWSKDKTSNSQVLRGMYEVLSSHGKSVGLYSTSYQYNRIAGTYSPAAGVPLWIPGWSSATDNHAAECKTAPTFAGGVAAMLQWTGTYDQNYAC